MALLCDLKTRRAGPCRTTHRAGVAARGRRRHRLGHSDHRPSSLTSVSPWITVGDVASTPVEADVEYRDGARDSTRDAVGSEGRRMRGSCSRRLTRAGSRSCCGSSSGRCERVRNDIYAPTGAVMVRRGPIFPCLLPPTRRRAEHRPSVATEGRCRHHADLTHPVPGSAAPTPPPRPPTDDYAPRATPGCPSAVPTNARRPRDSSSGTHSGPGPATIGSACSDGHAVSISVQRFREREVRLCPPLCCPQRSRPGSRANNEDSCAAGARSLALPTGWAATLPGEAKVSSW